jgi:5-methylcytosine-specific restriction endonuclease McrA
VQQVAQLAALQRQTTEDEEPLQAKLAPTAQRAGMDDMDGPDDEEPLQGKFDAVQRQPNTAEPSTAEQRSASDAAPRPNHTGLPDSLKTGIESLSGMRMDSVRVHYNSAKPAQLNAYAYAQGTDIHVGPGQEKHLPHEAWHVVQQAQGRVRPTMQMKGGVPVNDDEGLEREADVMGEKALQTKTIFRSSKDHRRPKIKIYQFVKHPITRRDNYTKRQRVRILNNNIIINKGYYTCTNLKCGFQNKSLTYATLRGRRMGDGMFHVDHAKKPAAHGGKAQISNSAVLCGTCNTSKGSREEAKTTGMMKFEALHRKKPKDYKRKPNKSK